MSITTKHRYQVVHETRYAYTSPVWESVNEIHLSPGSFTGQRVLEHEVTVKPSARLFAQRDFLGNPIHTFYLPKPVSELVITTKCVIELFRNAQFPGSVFTKEDLLAQAFRDKHYLYLMPTYYTYTVPGLAEWLGDLWAVSDTIPQFLLRVNQKIYDSFEYTPGVTDVQSRVDELAKLKKGVCQDFAHWMLSVLRMVGIPCRYVSGYIYNGDDAHLKGAQAMHAWVDVLVQEKTWVGLDPTNGCLAGNAHIYLCVGRDYQDIVPVRGVYKGELNTMEVNVEVSRLNGKISVMPQEVK